MRTTLAFVALVAISVPAIVSAQLGPDAASAEPFKLGTFEVDGVQTIGIVLRDQLIVELDAANDELQRDPTYPNVTMPEDMTALIGQYEYGLKFRLYEIVTDLVDNASLDGRARPGFVHDLDDVRTLAPLMPGKMLNAAVNFYSHVEEANTPEEQRAAAERRRATRGIPYLFIKPTAGAVIGQGDDVVIPYGRDRIDWEVELAIVIGRTAKYISAADAANYIFGYMVSIDISDRGGRPPDSRPGRCWDLASTATAGSVATATCAVACCVSATSPAWPSACSTCSLPSRRRAWASLHPCLTSPAGCCSHGQ